MPQSATEDQERNRPTALYKIYGSDDLLLYVGIGFSPITRWAFHSSRTWWLEVRKVEVEWFDTRNAAEKAERSAIQDLRPVHNITHNRPAKPARSKNQISTEERASLKSRIDSGEWLRTGDVAKFLDMSYTEVNRLIRTGMVTYRLEVGSKIRNCNPRDVGHLAAELQMRID